MPEAQQTINSRGVQGTTSSCLCPRGSLSHETQYSAALSADEGFVMRCAEPRRCTCDLGPRPCLPRLPISPHTSSHCPSPCPHLNPVSPFLAPHLSLLPYPSTRASICTVPPVPFSRYSLSRQRHLIRPPALKPLRTAWGDGPRREQGENLREKSVGSQDTGHRKLIA